MEAEESSDLDDDSDASVDLDDSNPGSNGVQWTPRVRHKITFEDKNKLEFSFDNFHKNYSHCTMYKETLEGDNGGSQHGWLTGAIYHGQHGSCMLETRITDST